MGSGYSVVPNRATGAQSALVGVRWYHAPLGFDSATRTDPELSTKTRQLLLNKEKKVHLRRTFRAPQPVWGSFFDLLRSP